MNRPSLCCAAAGLLALPRAASAVAGTASTVRAPTSYTVGFDPSSQSQDVFAPSLEQQDFRFDVSYAPSNVPLLTPGPALPAAAPISPAAGFTSIVSANPAPAAVPARTQAQSQSQPPSVLQESRREPAPRDGQPTTLEGTRELAADLEKGGSARQQTALDHAYIGTHDHALLGPEANAVVEGLVSTARTELAKPRPAKPGEKPVPPKPVTDRIWGWIEGSQSAYRIPILEWLTERRRQGLPLPQGWTLERLELKLALLNEEIRRANLEGTALLPEVALEGVKILADDLSGGKSRLSIQRRLQEQGLAHLMDIGAFNLFGEKVITENLALFPGTKVEELAAVILHETLAAAERSHWDIVEWVNTLTERAFGLKEGGVKQSRMEDLVHGALFWAEQQLEPAAAPKPGPKAAEAAENGFDNYQLPFDPKTLVVSHEVGTIDKEEKFKFPFNTASLKLSAGSGYVYLNIGNDQRPDGWRSDPELARNPAPRTISLWFSPEKRAKARQIKLLTAEEIRQSWIHSMATDIEQEKDPGPMISPQRFYYELLDDLDEAIRIFLEAPDSPVDTARFVEQVYASFRYNFGATYRLALPPFEYRRPAGP